MLQKYRHVIWDWNGTLLDDAWLCVEIINEMLRAHPDLTIENLPKEKEMLPNLVEQMLSTAPV